MRIGHGYDV
ncbi:MAG TPA: hypothetical protein DEQ60_10520, partial [Methylophaga sp.]|nr:hypothetical protein [Methylophaga sp.]